jgi:2-succinyl-5-enolpyruvyl-6-hydroxy-3-cyclohexene-1-carboxylate synthase
LNVADHPAFEAHFLAPHEADLLQLSKAAGVDCRRVKDLADLGEGLAEALSTPGVSVLVAHVDRALDEALRGRAFAEVARALASSAKPSPGVPASSP